MSSYLYFYAKNKDGNDFIRLGEFSRSSVLYGAAHCYAPNEKVSVFNQFDTVLTDLKDILKRYKYDKKCYKEENKMLMKNMADPEKALELYRDNVQNINDLNEEIKSVDAAIYFLHFLSDIVYYNNAEIYVGIEIDNPTIEDIKVN